MERPGALGALGVIGDTPVARLASVVEPGMAEVWVKLEAADPAGSYKDRMAPAMIEGYPLTVVNSDAFAVEKLKTMGSFGADVVIIELYS